MIQNIKVAVTMPAFNAAKYIEDALASLLRQRADAKLDIIVVDDGSTDGTPDVVRRLGAQAPEIRLVERANGGVAAARNSALAAITPDTDLVTALDADDLSPPGRFDRDIAHFTADPDLDVLYASMRAFRGPAHDQLQPVADSEQIDLRGVQLGALMMRRVLAERIGPFDETLRQCEDVDYFFRMFQLAPKTKLSDEISVYYRRHEGNITRDRQTAVAAFRQSAMRHAVRVRKGGAPVPPGFFDPRAFSALVEWW
ncbi:MAG: glycosyltransferase [Devosia sp.]